jgi:cellulase/cellobiase CelA1
VGAFSTAIWLNTIARTASLGKILDDATAQQASLGKPVIVTFVVYDLPGRDCHANVSNGELTLSAGDIQRYRTGNPDATQGAPQAGEWFASFFSMMVGNATPPLCAAPSAKYCRRSQRETFTSPMSAGTSTSGPMTAARAAPWSMPNVGDRDRELEVVRRRGERQARRLGVGRADPLP